MGQGVGDQGVGGQEGTYIVSNWDVIRCSSNAGRLIRIDRTEVRGCKFVSLQVRLLGYLLPP